MMLPTLISVETVHEGNGGRGKIPAPMKRGTGRRKSVAAEKNAIKPNAGQDYYYSLRPKILVLDLS